MIKMPVAMTRPRITPGMAEDGEAETTVEKTILESIQWGLTAAQRSARQLLAAGDDRRAREYGQPIAEWMREMADLAAGQVDLATYVLVLNGLETVYAAGLSADQPRLRAAT